MYERLYGFIERQGNWLESFEEGLERVREGNFALIVEEDLALFAAQSGPCDVVIVGKNLFNFEYSLALPIGSDLLHPINLALLDLKETGQVNKLYKKHWMEQNECLNPRFNMAPSMSNHGFILTAFAFFTARFI